MSTQVNRYLENSAMDDIDHALGRPVDPLIESHRNHYAVDARSEQAKYFDTSPFWTKHGNAAPGGMLFYTVTEVGRQALKQHLKEIGDKNRWFTVKYEGHETNVVAETASKARYSYWLDVSDSRADLTFATFCKSVSIRIARGVQA